VSTPPPRDQCLLVERGAGGEATGRRRPTWKAKG